MLDQIPTPAHQFELEEIDGEILLYSPTVTRTIFLNQTASLVWQLCGEGLSIGEIIETLAEAFPEAGDSLKGDVEDCINKLVEDQAIYLERS